MKITIKVGTMPAHLYYVKNKRKPPKIGDILMIRRDNSANWERVKVDMIRDIGGLQLYFAAR